MDTLTAPRIRRWVGVLLAGLLGLAASPAPASAETTLEIEAGFGGDVPYGRSIPIWVRITTDEVFDGELRVTFGGMQELVRPIELAAGTTREVEFVVSSMSMDMGAVQVSLVAEGTDEPLVTKNANIQVRWDAIRLAIGVFPSLATAAMPESAALFPESGSANLFKITSDVFDMGPAGIDALHAIALTADDLRDLDPTDADILMAWLNGGGRLVVDEGPGAELPVLPAAWQPTGTAVQAAGRGEVQLTSGRLAAGDWSNAISPTPARGNAEQGAFADVGSFWGGDPISWELGRDAGVGLPTTPILLLGLLVYVLLIGPVLWIVLRVLRRPGLAWVCVPVLALLMTGFVFLAGSSLRRGIRPAHGTIVEVAERGSTTTTFELVTSRSGGRVGIDLPAGWAPAMAMNDSAPPRLDLRITEDGRTEYGATVDSGGFALLGGSGTASRYDATIEVTAASEASGVVIGTITNHLDVTLRDVGVFADLAGQRIDDIPAGGTVEFRLNAQPQNPQMGEPVEVNVWKDAFPAGWFGSENATAPRGAALLGLWAQWVQRAGSTARSVGDLVVAGWSDEVASPLEGGAERGRTLFVAQAHIAPSDGVVVDVSSRRTLQVAGAALPPEYRNLQFWGGGGQFAFEVPPGTKDPVLQIPATQRRVDLWVDGAWQRLAVAEAASAVYALPESAIVDGRVYVRALLNFETGVDLRRLSVRTATDRDPILPLELSQEAVG